uniref:PDZ domain-containing protein n=1 Tax=Globisporangium ultimum (strain ATCC 200006 / CBS 805.95 / DAOM BR144) TaxID=431595 RepID=K3WZE7_GLOUD
MSSRTRGLRADSAGSNGSGFGDDSLPPDEYIQRRLQQMSSLMTNGTIAERDEASSANPIDAASPLLAPPDEHGGVADDVKPKNTMSVLEKLQALSLQDPFPMTHLVENGLSLPTPDVNRFFGEDDSGYMGDSFDAMPLPLGMLDDDDDDDEDDAYVITWEGGQLGLIFKANPAGQVVIRRVNKKGTALGLHYARAGDVLVGLNGISVQGVPFLEIVEQLKNPHFPIKLEFEPMKFAAVPPGVLAAAATIPYTYSANAMSKDMPSPTSSAGTVEVTDQDSSYVYVPRSGEDSYRDGADRQTLSVTMSTPSAAHYDVVWDEGPLGCGLKHRSGYPTVKSVNPTGVSPSVAQIGAGDVLIVINGYKTKEIGFKSAIAMLQRAPKPIYLRFRRQPPIQSDGGAAGVSSGNSTGTEPRIAPADPALLVPPGSLPPLQYTVVWRDGPLGIQIKSGSNGLVFVSRLTGAGNPSMTRQITPGDLFVRIGGVDVASRGIAGAFELLKTVQKPVALVFQRPSKDDASAPLPSFRKLREEAAMAAASTGNAGERGDGGFRHRLQKTQSAGRCEDAMQPQYSDDFDDSRASWQTRTLPNPHSSSVDATFRMRPPVISKSHSCDFDSTSDTGSQRSNARTDYADYLRASQYPTEGVPPPAADDSTLPRFSDIEAGRVVTTEVTALPPPPSYLDVFTQSGRSRDPIPDMGAVRYGAGSPPSESISVTSSGQRSPRSISNPMMSPPPPPPPMPMDDDFGMLPPPPQYSSFFSGQDAPGPVSRLQELRQQYIEAERRRNQGTQFAGTILSSYSDLDDSGVMRQRHAAGGPHSGAASSFIARAPMNPPPLPELWVRWSDGPLGITFKRKNGQIVVSRLTGAGLSPGLEQLRTGDWLVSFNNYSTRDLRLSETMELLKRLPKPIDMCFVVQ